MKWLTFSGVVAVCIASALIIKSGRIRSQPTKSARPSGDLTDAKAELTALLKQPNDERMDIARMSLLAGSGLSQGEDIPTTNLVRELDAMTARVKAETARHLARFHRAPEEFNGSEAYFKMLCLVTVYHRVGVEVTRL